LAPDVTEAELKNTFAGRGEIASIKMLSGRRGRNSTKYAYVEMTSDASAAEALEALRGTELKGHRLDIVLEEPAPTQRPRRQFRGGRRR
jgi:RNA recognition motif-containing protein